MSIELSKDQLRIKSQMENAQVYNSSDTDILLWLLNRKTKDGNSFKTSSLIKDIKYLFKVLDNRQGKVGGSNDYKVIRNKLAELEEQQGKIQSKKQESNSIQPLQALKEKYTEYIKDKSKCLEYETIFVGMYLYDLSLRGNDLFNLKSKDYNNETDNYIDLENKIVVHNYYSKTGKVRTDNQGNEIRPRKIVKPIPDEFYSLLKSYIESKNDVYPFNVKFSKKYSNRAVLKNVGANILRESSQAILNAKIGVYDVRPILNMDAVKKEQSNEITSEERIEIQLNHGHSVKTANTYYNGILEHQHDITKKLLDFQIKKVDLEIRKVDLEMRLLNVIKSP